jgi:hypothetical protein
MTLNGTEEDRRAFVAKFKETKDDISEHGSNFANNLNFRGQAEESASDLPDEDLDHEEDMGETFFAFKPKK